MNEESRANPHERAGVRAKAAVRALQAAIEESLAQKPEALDSLVPLSGEEAACRDALTRALKKFEAR